MAVRVAIRTDASSIMGSGHVMRCLTLAGGMRLYGANAVFICREHHGHLCNLIEERGFQVVRLSRDEFDPPADSTTAHGSWLGAAWQQDAEQTRAAIAGTGGHADWLIIDHYAIEQRWERSLRRCAARLLVIDDLADRVHDCDLLLDQNLFPEMLARYDGLVPAKCELMLGPKYALLQQQYGDLHDNAAPKGGSPRSILIYFGGADVENLTGRALSAVLNLGRPDIQVDVVLSIESPHAAAVHAIGRAYDNVTFHDKLPSLAPLMAQADLAVGACGATSWERLCLGLPAIVVTLAENQRLLARHLDERGLIVWLGHKDQVDVGSITGALLRVLRAGGLADWSRRCRELCDGRGASRVMQRMNLGISN